jgi:hypothetical protein
MFRTHFGNDGHQSALPFRTHFGNDGHQSALPLLPHRLNLPLVPMAFTLCFRTHFGNDGHQSALPLSESLRTFIEHNLSRFWMFPSFTFHARNARCQLACLAPHLLSLLSHLKTRTAHLFIGHHDSSLPFIRYDYFGIVSHVLQSFCIFVF